MPNPTDTEALRFAGKLTGEPIGYRAKSKAMVRRRASDLDHTLGRFKARKYSADFGKRQDVMYSVAWCSKCGDAAFTGMHGQTNPALDRKCPGSK